MTPRRADRLGLGLIVGLMVLATGVIVWVGLDRQAPISPSSDAGVISAPQSLTVVVLLDIPTERPTQTPWIRVVTVTPSPTMTREALCGQEDWGESCLLYPPPVTPTPTSTPEWCDHVTPSAAGYPQVCRPVYQTTAREVVE